MISFGYKSVQGLLSEMAKTPSPQSENDEKYLFFIMLVIIVMD